MSGDTVWLVLPAFNEGETLPLLHERLVSLADANPEVELRFLVVDDHSTDATPDAMTVKNCGSVRPRRYGRTTSGASVCPTKIFAAAFIDSIGPDPMTQRSAPPTPLTIHCMIFR